MIAVVSSSRLTRPQSDVLLYFLAFFIPPIAVFLKTGCDSNFIINICLTILGWIPGVLHAWWVISKYEKPAHAY